MNSSVKSVLGEGEESQELALANEILRAVKAGDKQAVIAAAGELIRLHVPNAKASYEREARKRQPRQLQAGTITPQQFQSGEPWWGKRNKHHRTEPVLGMKPLE